MPCTYEKNVIIDVLKQQYIPMAEIKKGEKKR